MTDQKNNNKECLTSIPLTKGKFAIIESRHLNIVNVCKWHCLATGYANNSNQMRMHRLLWESVNGAIPKGFEIDHINQDKLDNRLSNLRLVTQSQNNMNRVSYKNSTSKYKGVHWSTCASKWLVQITKDKKTYYLGVFVDETEAARAYDKKAKELFGDYACLNFPDD